MSRDPFFKMNDLKGVKVTRGKYGDSSLYWFLTRIGIKYPLSNVHLKTGRVIGYVYPLVIDLDQEDIGFSYGHLWFIRIDRDPYFYLYNVQIKDISAIVQVSSLPQDENKEEVREC